MTPPPSLLCFHHSLTHPPPPPSIHATITAFTSADLPPAIGKHKRQNMVGYTSPRTARQTRGLQVWISCSTELHKSETDSGFALKRIPHQINTKKKGATRPLFRPTRVFFLIKGSVPLTVFVPPNIISINTSVFTARVLSRPQHGM